jgi:hypothetical protein
MSRVAHTNIYVAILTFPFPGISLQEPICQVFANLSNSEILACRSTCGHYWSGRAFLAIQVSEFRYSGRLSSNRSVVRQYDAPAMRPMARSFSGST